MGEGRRFHLLERLGEGAHGEVFLAEQESTGGFRRRVALKVLRPELGHADEAARRMRDEARILGRLAHRNIVTVTDLVRLEDRWAVVMDYLPGADLDRVISALELADEYMPPRAAVAIAAGMLAALHAAWEVDNGSGDPLRLVHRDIKPSNVLLTAEGDVKVLDFGVAQVDLVGREARTGRFTFGTERYMPPERISGAPGSRAGDLYASVATLVELLLREPLGRTPIEADRHQNMVETTLGRIRERVGPGEATEALVVAIRDGLACDPDARPEAGPLADRLGALAADLPGQGLIPFARAFVPRVGQLVGVQGKPASGTLLEATSGPETELGWSDVDTLQPADPPTRPIWWAIGGAAAILLVVCAGAATTYFGSTMATAPAAVETTSPQAVGTVRVRDVPDVVYPDRTAATPAVTASVEMPAPSPSAQPTPVPPRRVASASRVSTLETAPVAEPIPRVPATSASTDERVPAAFFALPNASKLHVRCGDVERDGTASVRIRDVPAGPCTVTATYLGQALSTEVVVQSRREVRCAVSGGNLQCR